MKFHDYRCNNYIKLYGFETQLKAGKIWDEKRAAKGLFLHQEDIITFGILAHVDAGRGQTTANITTID